MLKKQSIRSNHIIKLNGRLLEKDEVIELSKEWEEKEEMFFRKLLQQGGRMNIDEGKIEVKKSL